MGHGHRHSSKHEKSRTYGERASSSSSSDQERTYAIRQKRDFSDKPQPHRQSSGDTGSDADRLHRALRPDERPYEEGIVPKAGFNENKTMNDHVAAGTTAAEKTPYVSSSRDRHRADSYAASRKGGRVATMKETSEIKERSVDFTLAEEREKYLTGASARNFAKSSREVLTKNGFSKDDVMEVADLVKISVKEHDSLKAQLKSNGDSPTYVQYEGRLREVVKVGRGRAEKSKNSKDKVPHPYMRLKIERPAEPAPQMEYPRRVQSSSPTLGYGGYSGYDNYTPRDTSAPPTFDSSRGGGGGFTTEPTTYTYAQPEQFYYPPQD